MFFIFPPMGTESLNRGAFLAPGRKSKDDDEENMDRRRKPIEPLPRVNHDEIDYPEVEFGFYKPHPEHPGRCAQHIARECDRWLLFYVVLMLF
jgi:hypothetical protein